MILGYIFAPIAFIIEYHLMKLQVGSFINKKLLNEFCLYYLLKFKIFKRKSVVITTFALCGFTNISSIAIQLGVFSSIALKTSFSSKISLKCMQNFSKFDDACIAGLQFKTHYYKIEFCAKIFIFKYAKLILNFINLIQTNDNGEFIETTKI